MLGVDVCAMNFNIMFEILGDANEFVGENANFVEENKQGLRTFYILSTARPYIFYRRKVQKLLLSSTENTYRIRAPDLISYLKDSALENRQ